MKKSIAIVLLSVFVISSCKKEETPSPPKKYWHRCSVQTDLLGYKYREFDTLITNSGRDSLINSKKVSNCYKVYGD